jgi:hypothetical protein
MRRTIISLTICIGVASIVHADDEIKDYTGPFTTQVLYDMCSRSDRVSRNKCYMYIQGLIYGIKTQRVMREHGMDICLPEMAPEEARLRILNFIDGTTGGRPQNNKDGGNWMAFLGLSTGNLCSK